MRECVCPNCNANLSIHDTNRDFAFCEFCGAKIMLDDYRITQHIINEAQLRRVEVEQENLKFKALQSQRFEILARWDAEQAKEEFEIAKAKKNFITCCCLLFLAYPIFAIPFFAVKYDNLKKNYESKKKHRDYMRTLPLDKFFQQMEVEWQKYKEDEEKPKSFLQKKLW